MKLIKCVVEKGLWNNYRLSVSWSVGLMYCNSLSVVSEMCCVFVVNSSKGMVVMGLVVIS